MLRDGQSGPVRLRDACAVMAVLIVLAGCAGTNSGIPTPSLQGGSMGPDLNWNFCDGGDPGADYNCSGRGN